MLVLAVLFTFAALLGHALCSQSPGLKLRLSTDAFGEWKFTALDLLNTRLAAVSIEDFNSKDLKAAAVFSDIRDIRISAPQPECQIAEGIIGWTVGQNAQVESMANFSINYWRTRENGTLLAKADITFVLKIKLTASDVGDPQLDVSACYSNVFLPDVEVVAGDNISSLDVRMWYAEYIQTKLQAQYLCAGIKEYVEQDLQTAVRKTYPKSFPMFNSLLSLDNSLVDDPVVQKNYVQFNTVGRFIVNGTATSLTGSGTSDDLPAFAIPVGKQMALECSEYLLNSFGTAVDTVGWLQFNVEREFLRQLNSESLLDLSCSSAEYCIGSLLPPALQLPLDASARIVAQPQSPPHFVISTAGVEVDFYYRLELRNDADAGSALLIAVIAQLGIVLKEPTFNDHVIKTSVTLRYANLTRTSSFGDTEVEFMLQEIWQAAATGLVEGVIREKLAIGIELPRILQGFMLISPIIELYHDSIVLAANLTSPTPV